MKVIITSSDKARKIKKINSHHPYFPPSITSIFKFALCVLSIDWSVKAAGYGSGMQQLSVYCPQVTVRPQ